MNLTRLYGRLAACCGLAMMLTACVVPPTATEPVNPDVVMNRELHQYLIVQGEQIGLINVTDDGTYTFFAFESAPTALEIFDQAGKPLMSATQGNIIGIRGVFDGLLLRTGGAANSFVTPNPRQKHAPRPKLDGNPQVATVMRTLDAQALALPAFHRTLELVERQSATAAAQRSPLVSRSSTDSEREAPRSVFESPEGRIHRVFFAAGGRAVVSPDDGLARIENEAARASGFIRITGYSDSVGNATHNEQLAQRRAESIRAYLIRQGVAPDKIMLSWDGNGGYIATNDTERGRALNRRAEILIERPPATVTTAAASRS